MVEPPRPDGTTTGTMRKYRRAKVTVTYTDLDTGAATSRTFGTMAAAKTFYTAQTLAGTSPRIGKVDAG